MTAPARYRCDSCGTRSSVSTEHWRIITDPGPAKHLVPAERLDPVHICDSCKDDPWAESRACSQAVRRRSAK